MNQKDDGMIDRLRWYKTSIVVTWCWRAGSLRIGETVSRIKEKDINTLRSGPMAELLGSCGAVLR